MSVKQAKYYHEEIETLKRDISDLQRKVARGMVHKTGLLDQKIGRLQYVASLWAQGKDQLITRSTARVHKTALERKQGPAYSKAERMSRDPSLILATSEPELSRVRPKHVCGVWTKQGVSIPVEHGKPYDPRPVHEVERTPLDYTVPEVVVSRLTVTYSAAKGKPLVRIAKDIIDAMAMMDEAHQFRMDYQQVVPVFVPVRGKMLSCLRWPDGSRCTISK